MSLKNRIYTSTFLFFSAISTTSADTVNEPWQNLREAVGPITDRACLGDAKDVAEVWDRVKNKSDYVLQNNLGWLDANCDAFSVSNTELAKWQRNAALHGYPIAQSGYGHRLLLGDGVKNNPQKGIYMLGRAVEGGYANAAAWISQYYSKGEYILRNMKKAKIYLDIAKGQGADQNVIQSAQTHFDSATAERAAKSRKIKETEVCSIGFMKSCKSASVYATTNQLVSFDGCGKHRTSFRAAPSVPDAAKGAISRLLIDFESFIQNKYPECTKSPKAYMEFYEDYDEKLQHDRYLAKKSNQERMNFKVIFYR